MADRHLKPVHVEEPLVSRAELALILRCSEDSIDRMRKDGMPAIRWGRKMIRFKPSACVAWLDTQGREAA